MTRIEEIEARAKEEFIYDPYKYRNDVVYLLSENKRMREALQWLKDTQHLGTAAAAIVDAAIKEQSHE